MKLSTIVAFLTVAVIGAGAYRIGFEVPSDDEWRDQLRGASRTFKNGFDSAVDFVGDAVNPPSEGELLQRQISNGFRDAVDTAGDLFNSVGNTVRRKYATGSASSRWTGYNGVAALIGTWVAVLVVM